MNWQSARTTNVYAKMAILATESSNVLVGIDCVLYIFKANSKKYRDILEVKCLENPSNFSENGLNSQNIFKLQKGSSLEGRVKTFLGILKAWMKLDKIFYVQNLFSTAISIILFVCLYLFLPCVLLISSKRFPDCLIFHAKICNTIYTSKKKLSLYLIISFLFFISILKMNVKAQNAIRMPAAKAESVHVNLVSKETEKTNVNVCFKFNQLLFKK